MSMHSTPAPEHIAEDITNMKRKIPLHNNLERYNFSRQSKLCWSSASALLFLPLSLLGAAASGSNAFILSHRKVHLLPSTWTSSTRLHCPFDRPRRKKRVVCGAIPLDGASDLLMQPSSAVNTAPNSMLLAGIASTCTYLTLLAYYDRPRGAVLIPDPQTSLLVQPSRVPGAGLGLFVTRPFPQGTILGAYPGVLRPAKSFYDGKCRRFPQAVMYSWRLTDNENVIDPTDSNGEIQPYCIGGSSEVPLSNFVFQTLLGFWKVPTTLARINEPPTGVGGCNVSAREDLAKREVLFELCRDVVAGEELFMDYGIGYDRSGYGPPAS